MDCRQTREWLLRSDTPGAPENQPRLIAVHLAGCSACRSLETKVARLEEQWRSWPLPAEAESARKAFLDRLARPTTKKTIPSPSAGGRQQVRRLAAAAALFLTLGVVAWFLTPPAELQASTDVVSELVEWNLQLAQAPSLHERSRVYTQRGPVLQAALQKALLPLEERDLAQRLLENGRWLESHDDPIEEAQRFDALADLMLDEIDNSVTQGRPVTSERLARRYHHLAADGLYTRLDHLKASPALTSAQQRRLERLEQRDARRLEKLAEMVERTPKRSRKEIRKALDLGSKQHKRKDKQKPARSKPKHK
jgi:hypothetical protein